ncbi:hypothetical protein [Deinococcus sp.]|uniref:hypothetical protein n=1 Tax=Deinococcus sp. TaxID=47478 RepID=UPI0025B941D9|nr:hypothetical protein [Deinococcus sp.]
MFRRSRTPPPATGSPDPRKTGISVSGGRLDLTLVAAGYPADLMGGALSGLRALMRPRVLSGGTRGLSGQNGPELAALLDLDRCDLRDATVSLVVPHHREPWVGQGEAGRRAGEVITPYARSGAVTNAFVRVGGLERLKPQGGRNGGARLMGLLEKRPR